MTMERGQYPRVPKNRSRTEHVSGTSNPWVCFGSHSESFNLRISCPLPSEADGHQHASRMSEPVIQSHPDHMLVNMGGAVERRPSGDPARRARRSLRTPARARWRPSCSPCRGRRASIRASTTIDWRRADRAPRRPRPRRRRRAPSPPWCRRAPSPPWCRGWKITGGGSLHSIASLLTGLILPKLRQQRRAR